MGVNIAFVGAILFVTGYKGDTELESLEPKCIVLQSKKAN